jgi:hypothetical protein
MARTVLVLEDLEDGETFTVAFYTSANISKEELERRVEAYDNSLEPSLVGTYLAMEAIKMAADYMKLANKVPVDERLQ